MKKILIALLLFLLCACKQGDVINNSAREKYNDMVDFLREHDTFTADSELFDISYDVSRIEGGYRFYIIIDNVRTAMYDVTAIAIEPGVDYSSTMAASIGIFEENDYSLIPNQYNAQKGFVKGISISGLSDTERPELLLMVEWKNKDMSVTYREFIRLNASGGNDE